MHSMGRHAIASASLLLLLALPAYPVSVDQSLPISIEYGGQFALTLHEPVVFNAVVRNQSGERLKVDFGKNFVAGFYFTLTSPDGSVKIADPSLPRRADQGWEPGVVTVDPFSEYKQPILLNDWFDFLQVGTYQLDVRFRGSFASQVQTFQISQTESVQIEVRPFDERLLRARCENLLRGLQSGATAKQWTENAQALAAVNHPIAVEYLNRAIEIGHLAELFAIEALERIGGDAAARALEEAAANGDFVVAESAIAALSRLLAKPR